MTTGDAVARLVPASRLERWVENFALRHGSPALAVVDGRLRGEAPDGSTFVAALPFGAGYDGPPEVAGLVGAAAPPARWGVLLVRKGGFAVALLDHGRVVGQKVGRRHVQGRTKAGGQSQQRFARRRDNQARHAFEAAAEQASQVLGATAGLPLLVGGDRTAVDRVLADPRLRGAVRVEPWLPVPDPRSRELAGAIADAQAVRVVVCNAPQQRPARPD